MDFGLGLILSFTDNASAGINNAVNTLDRLTQTAQGASSSLNEMASLSALSVVAGQMGNAFAGAGTSILSVFSNLLGNVRTVGQDFENFRITLDALYGRDFTDIGERTEYVNAQLQKLLDFSVKSPFEVNDVKEMLIVLKSQGIDAFQELQGSITGTKQETLAWIADLMAFKPEVSAERWKLAFQNYIGSGESKILRNALDMGKIEDILGHDMGKTTEERMNDLMEIIEKQGLTGLAEKLSTTWSGVASNVSDAMTKLYKVIADNGVFDALKNSFMGLAGLITTLEPEDLSALGKALADGLNMVVAPIVKVVELVNKLVMGFVDLVKQNPAIAKFAVVLGVVSGALLVFVGLALKATSALSGVALMYLAFGKSFDSIGALFRTGALKIMGVLIPLGLAIAALYAVWKTDFAGIRSTLIDFVKNTVNSFNTAKNAVSGSLATLQRALNGLDVRDNFFDGLTYAIMRLMVLGKALVEGWNNYTLSDATFLKAQKLGILPLIEAIFTFLYRFRLFKEGFIEGWKNISTSIKNIIGGIIKSVDGTIFESLFQGILSFMKSLSNNDAQAWRTFGVFLGELSAKAVAFGLAFKLVKLALSPIVSIVLKAAGVFKVLFNLFGGAGKFVGVVIRSFREVIALLHGGFIVPVTRLGQLFVRLGGFMSRVASIASNIGSVFSSIGSIIMSVLGIISTVIGIPVAAVAAVIATVLGSIIAFAVTSRDKFVSLFSGLWEHIKSVFNGVSERFKTVSDTIKSLCAPVTSMVTGAIDNIKSAIGNLTSSGTLRTVLASIIRVLSFLGELIMGLIVPALRLIASVIGGVVKAAIDVLGGSIAGILTVIGSVISGVVNVISGLINILTGIFNTIGGLIKGLLTGDWSTFSNGLKSVGTGILEFFGGIIEALGGVVAGIAEVVGGIVLGVFDLGVNIVLGLIDGIASFIGNAVTAVVDFFKSILDAVKNFLGIHSPSTVFAEIGMFLIQGLINGVESMFSAVLSVFTTIKDIIISVWNTIVSVVSSAVQGACKIIEGAINVITGIFSTFSKVVVSVFTTLWNLVSTAVHSVWESIYSFFSGIFENILNVTQTVWSNFFGFLSNLWNTITTTAYTVFGSLVSFVIGLWNTILNITQTVWNSIRSLIDIVVTGIQIIISNIFGNILNVTQNVWNTLYGFLSTLWNVITTTAQSVLGVLISFMTNLWSTILGVTQTVWNTLKSIISTVLTGIQTIVSGIFEKILDITQTIWNNFLGFLSTLWNTVTYTAQSVLGVLVSFVTNLWNNIFGITQTVWSTISSTIGNIVTGIQTLISGIFENILGVTQDIWGNLFGFLSTLWNTLTTIAQTIWNSIKNTIDIVVTGIQNVISGTFETIFSVTQTVWNNLFNFLATLWNTTIATAQSVLGAILSFVSNLWNAVFSVTQSVWNSIKNTIGILITGIKTLISSIFGAISSFLSGNMNGVRQNINNAWNAIKSIFTTVGSAISTVVSNVFNGIKNTISNVINSAKNTVSSGLNAIKGFFSGLKLEFPKIKLPHFKIEGNLSIAPPSVPKLAVDWYERGGIFSQPSVIGVGENGKEAVMPLENNTQWIGLLAKDISSYMNDLTPVGSQTYNSNTSTYGGASTQEYMTTNQGNVSTSNEYDHSVTFGEGSIVIQVQNASEEEAERLAKTIMERIKREQEIENMKNYRPIH